MTPAANKPRSPAPLGTAAAIAALCVASLLTQPCLGQSGDEVAPDEVKQAVYEPLAAIGGSISAEHGIGLDKKKYLRLSRNEQEIALMRRLKRALDPNGILNPGKIFDLG